MFNYHLGTNIHLKCFDLSFCALSYVFPRDFTASTSRIFSLVYKYIYIYKVLLQTPSEGEQKDQK